MIILLWRRIKKSPKNIAVLPGDRNDNRNRPLPKCQSLCPHRTPLLRTQGTIAVVDVAAVKVSGNWMGNGLSLLVSIALRSTLIFLFLLDFPVFDN